MRKVAALALVAVLGGCASAQERAMAQASADHNACLAYGAQPRTPAYVQCRVALDEGRRTRAAAWWALQSHAYTVTRT